MIPCIDHNLLSPSGHISRRALIKARERFYKKLFPKGFPQPQVLQPPERETLLRQATELRQLAERGMKPRAYLKRAIKLEKKAKILECGGEMVDACEDGMQE